MWLKIVLFVSLGLFCNGNKDFSCKFNYGLCGWHVSLMENCHWGVEYYTFAGQYGYLSVKGARNCHTKLTWKFSMFDDDSANYLSLDYYVLGSGPFTLSVSNDAQDYKIDWGCDIQPGNMKREAHVKITGLATYIYITAHVAPGSELIITRIRKNDKVLYHQEQSCPRLPSTTSPPETTITPQNQKTITTANPKEKSRNQTAPRIISPSTLGKVSTTSEDYQTPPSSSLLNTPKVPNHHQPLTAPVTDMATGSTAVKFLMGLASEQRKGKQKGIIAGSAAGLVVLVIFFVSIIFFVRRRMKRWEPSKKQPSNCENRDDLSFSNQAYEQSSTPSLPNFLGEA